MKNYFITIVDNKTLARQDLKRDSETKLTETVKKEFGGWNNLHSATTSGCNVHENNFCLTGTTRDGKKSFSILCIEDTREQ